MILGIPLLTLLLIVVGATVAIGGPALVAELSWSGRPLPRRRATRPAFRMARTAVAW